MKIPKQEDFALLLMSELGRVHPGQLLPVSEVAGRHGVSPWYLKKIVRFLRQAGLVTSKEGLGGGYRLTKDPRRITVWDVMSAVSDQGHIDAVKKPSRVVCPLYSACLPQQIKQTVSRSVEESLRGISLARLIK